jgi:hypothetical protein
VLIIRFIEETIMRKNVIVVFCIFLMALAVPAFAQTQDQKKEPPKEQAKEPAKDASIAGVWTMSLQMPQGEMPPSDITITQEKDTIKVIMPGPQDMSLSGAGTIKDGAVQWTVVVNTPQGDFTLAFKGKVDGEKMSGDCQMGDFGTATWAATKKKQ